MNAAVYIEQQSEGTDQFDGWVGYAYPTKVGDKAELAFVKKSFDQRGKPVEVYRASTFARLDTPGGVISSDLVVLFDAA